MTLIMIQGLKKVTSIISLSQKLFEMRHRQFLCSGIEKKGCHNVNYDAQ